MNKDKLYGFGLVLFFGIAFVLYTIAVPVPLLQAVLGESTPIIDLKVAYFWLMVPVFGGVFLFSLIVIWIGWTMATTPPPEPIDLDSLDLDDDEKKEETAKSEKPK
ncbi:MAG TPA: hypothetical protein VJ044_14855 [Candidatus Hodarchaeales archaeon]|nr:hypothetical protein [Candidatus Hodarchaeales archaeon]